MMIDGRELILSQAGKRAAPTPTSAAGVFAITFTALEYAEYERRRTRAIEATKPATKARLIFEANAYLLTVGLGDANGSPLFSETDFDKLAGLPSSTFQSLLSVVTVVNSMDACDLGTIAKNSDATDGCSLPTG
jgi:hypothetical protein